MLSTQRHVSHPHKHTHTWAHPKQFVAKSHKNLQAHAHMPTHYTQTAAHTCTLFSLHTHMLSPNWNVFWLQAHPETHVTCITCREIPRERRRERERKRERGKEGEKGRDRKRERDKDFQQKEYSTFGNPPPFWTLANALCLSVLQPVPVSLPRYKVCSLTHERYMYKFYSQKTELTVIFDLSTFGLTGTHLYLLVFCTTWT